MKPRLSSISAAGRLALFLFTLALVSPAWSQEKAPIEKPVAAKAPAGKIPAEKPAETAGEKAAAEKEAPGSTEAEPEPGVVTGKQPETLLEFTVAGGWLMIPIGLCSVVWLAFLFERLFVLRRRRVIPRELASAFAGLHRSPGLDRERLSVLLEAHPSAAATVLGAALDRIHLPRAEIEHAVNTVGQRELYALRRNLRLFAIVASVAPLMGLLGTVTGLIQSFREVAATGLGSGSSLAPGIYQALITTAGGLIVAIPSLLTYYWLMARVDHFAHEINNLVVDFVDQHHGLGPPAAGPQTAGHPMAAVSQSTGGYPAAGYPSAGSGALETR